MLLIFNSSCDSIAQQPDNTKPMYGEVEKSDAYQKIDEDFKKECMEQFKTIDSSVYVQTNNAWRYFYNNDLKSAMKRFNQAWLLNPDYPDSYFGFAALMDIQGNQTEAARFYQIAQEKDKTKERAVKCYQRIADCKEQLQDIKGTIEAYSKIAALDPNNVLALKKFGYFQMQNGNYKDALTAYEKAIELDPTDAMTYNNKGYLYHSIRNYKDAIANYTKAIDLDSKYISAYVNRGISEMEQNNFVAARKDFEICVQLDKTSGELRRMLGLSKISIDKKSACKDFKLAKELGDQQANELLTQYCK